MKKKIPFADEELLRVPSWQRLQQYFAIFVVHKTLWKPAVPN